MSSIDQRVVEMKFDNAAFGQGVKTTQDQLKGLKDSLQLAGATKGLEGVEAAAKSFSLGGIASAVDGIADKFSTMSIIGITALSNLVNKAIDAGARIVKSLTIAPVMSGFKSYTDTINATQTILANTKADGVDLAKVTSTLDTLQKYANQTVYSFSDMTQNIGRFTAAGVKIDDATSAIKGMANTAALSGASTEQMSSAMYQMSQALSVGTIKLQDWNSLSNANMAGSNIQNALKETARTMDDNGAAMDKAIEKQGSFRDSLTEGWLTADIYNKTMGVMAGTVDESTGKMRAFSVEELKAQGYTDEAAASLNELSTSALNSAIQIRTVPQMMDALKEEVATAWGSVFKVVFGNIDDATSLFTNLHNVLESALTGPIYKLKDFLQHWADLGGRAAAIDAISNAFKFLSSVLAPVKQAFSQIFPPGTGDTLFKITTAIDNFTKNLKIGGSTADEIKRTFAGLFAVVDIGWQIIKQAAKFVGDLIGMFASGNSSGGILKFTASIGDFLVAVDNAVKNGTFLTKFFHDLEVVLKYPIDAIKKLLGYLSNLSDFFHNIDFGKVTTGLSGVTDALKPATTLGDKLSSVWSKIATVFSAVWTALKPLAEKLGGVFATIGDSLSHIFDGVNFDQVLATINTVLFGGIVLLLKKFLSNFGKGGNKPTFLDSIKETLEGVTKSLTAMQNALKAGTLVAIAAAILLLAVAVTMIAKIDPAALAKSLTAIAVMFGELGVALKLFEKIGTTGSMLKLVLMGAALILLATAIDILASAVKKLSDMDMGTMLRGLVGLGIILRQLSTAVENMSGNQGKMITTAAGLVILSVAVKLLVDSVQDLAKMSWNELAKGLIGVSVLLGALTLFTMFSDAESGGIKQGAGLILLAVAIKLLASSVKDMADMDWATMARGMAGMAVGLAAITLAMNMMPDGNINKAAGILIVAGSLKLIAWALQDVGSMRWQDIIQGVGGLGASLVAIGLAMNMMPKESVGKAAGVLVVAASLKLIAIALQDVGSMRWQDIVQGVGGLGAVLLLISSALSSIPEGAIFSAAAVAIVAASLLIVAQTLQEFASMSWEDIGKAMTVLAGSLILISAALIGMEESLPGSAALLVAVIALTGLVPVLMLLGSMSWDSIIKGLVALAGAFVILSVGGILIEAAIPGLMGLAGAIAVLGLAVLLAGVGVLAFATGLGILAAAGAGATVVLVGMVMGLIALIPAIAVELGLGIIALGKVLIDAMPVLKDLVVAIIVAICDAIIESVPKLAETLMTLLETGLAVLQAAVPMVLQAGLNIINSLLDGIGQNIGGIVDKVSTIITNFLNALSANLPSIVQAGINLIVSFMNSVADGIRNNQAAIDSAVKNMASAIIQGLINGLAAGISGVIDAAKNLAKGALDAAKNFLGIHSPSREFQKLGEYSAQGFAKGLVGSKDDIDAAVKTLTDDLQDSMQAALDNVNKANDKIGDLGGTLAEQMHDMAAAQQALNDAYNMDTSSSAKTRAARAADTAKKEQARQKAIDAATEKVHNQQLAIDKTNKSIAEQQQIVSESTNEYNRASYALAVYNNWLQDEKARLEELADARDANNKAIEDEQKVLEDATKTRDDYNKSLRDQYGAQQTVSKDTNLADYLTNLRQQIVDTQQFTTAIQELRKNGLNDEMYKQLLSSGPSTMPFIQQLLDGGQSALDDLNNLGSTLDVAAGSLGDQASTGMYQAGVDAAAGLLKGLQDHAVDIENEMNHIANYMVSVINDALGIHSPSRVFAEVGAYSVQGLVNGLENASPLVGAAAEGVGQTAIDSMKKTISGLGDLISADVDMNPVIAPVLDLTSFKRDASTIGSLLDASSLSVDSTYSSAQDASAGYSANQSALSTAVSGDAQAPITFVQNNTSPKALSQADIYRQTKNQLSVAKGALTGSAR